MAKVKVQWLGGHLGGQSSTEDGRGVSVGGTPEALMAGTPEDGRGVAVTGIPKVLVVGTTEGPRPESPEVLVVETAELLPGTPEGPRPESPEALVAETAEEQPAVTETPKAVYTGIPEGPSS